MITTIISKATGFALLAGSLIALTPAAASAWSVNHSASSTCKDNAAVISWNFKNTEPNQAHFSIDLEVTNSENSSVVTETLAPGESANGTFTPANTQIDAGTVTFTMLWTDGRGGVDIRTSKYSATDECYVQEREDPAFTAELTCKFVGIKPVYTLNIEQTAGETAGVFTPENGATFNSGDAIEVLGIFDGGEVKVVETSNAADDCTPTQTTQVCRDGKIVTVNLSDKTDDDVEACEEPKVLAEVVVKELPKTGVSSLLSLFTGTVIAGVSAAQLHMRRKLQ